MSTFVPGPGIADPQLRDLLANLKLEILREMNCVKIGKIVSFDSTKKTAEVQVLTKAVLADGTIVSWPPLLDVPVVTIQGGTGGLKCPITAGDNCVVLFADRNIDAWYQNGAEAEPQDGRIHSASDGIAIVGLNALTSTMTAYPTTEVQLFNALGKVGVNSAGLVTVTNGTVTLLTLINALIDVIAAITDANNVPLSAASIAALQAYKLLFAALLY